MNDTTITKLEIPVEQMDYLSSRYDLKSHGDVISWGVRLLFDLSKAQEQNWNLTLLKSNIEKGKVNVDLNYAYASFLLEWPKPTEGATPRINADNLNKSLKINKNNE